MTVTALLKDISPPLLWRLARRLGGRGLRFSDHLDSWQSACAMSGGYAQASILDKVAQATRAVVAGQAAFERDSVLFHEPSYAFPVLAALLRVAALNSGKLDVVDFGGSLGSAYRQCRPFLAGLPALRWQVIEQAAFVTLGRAEFTTEELSFASRFDELAPMATPPVILAAGVLQYLEDPAAMVTEISRQHASHLVIDRAPLSAEARHRLCIQHVPKQVYEARYPSWILSRRQLMAQLAPDWRVLAEFPCEEGRCTTDNGLVFEFCGLILERHR
jgi:putative methyltransferase (TIGR04325 family)